MKKKLTESENVELDVLEEIVDECPELGQDILGSLGERYGKLIRRRSAEQQEAWEAEIGAQMAAEITKQIDNDIIKTLMGEIEKATIIPDSILHPNKLVKVEPDAEFNDNDPWIIGADNGLYSKAEIVTPGKSRWNLILTQDKPGWISSGRASPNSILTDGKAP